MSVLRFLTRSPAASSRGTPPWGATLYGSVPLVIQGIKMVATKYTCVLYFDAGIFAYIHSQVYLQPCLSHLLQILVFIWTVNVDQAICRDAFNILYFYMSCQAKLLVEIL